VFNRSPCNGAVIYDVNCRDKRVQLGWYCVHARLHEYERLVRLYMRPWLSAWNRRKIMLPYVDTCCLFVDIFLVTGDLVMKSRS